MPLNFQNARNLLYEFRLYDLFIDELGWLQPSSSRSEELEVEGQTYSRTWIAEMSGAQCSCTVERGARTRIISARVATRTEQRLYEQF